MFCKIPLDQLSRTRRLSIFSWRQPRNIDERNPKALGRCFCVECAKRSVQLCGCQTITNADPAEFLPLVFRSRSTPVDRTVDAWMAVLLSLHACRAKRAIAISSRGSGTRSLDALRAKCVISTMQSAMTWTPFCPDLDQAIFEPRDTIPKLWQICFQMASFGHLSLQIWIRPFSRPRTHPQSHCRFVSRWLHLNIFSIEIWTGHFRVRIQIKT